MEATAGEERSRQVEGNPGRSRGGTVSALLARLRERLHEPLQVLVLLLVEAAQQVKKELFSLGKFFHRRYSISM